MRLFNVPYRMFMLALLSALCVGACLIIAVVNLPILSALDARGVTTEAQIVSRSAPYRRWLGRQSNTGGLRVEIVYGFHTESGAWVTGRANKKWRYAEGLGVGRRFAVTYLPSKPEVFHSTLFKGYAGLGMIKALMILAAAASIAVLFLGARMPRQWSGPRFRPVVSFHHTEWWDAP